VHDPDQQEEGDLKEGYRIGNDLAPDHPLVRRGLPFHGPNQWPTGVPGFRETMEAYFAAVHHLAGQVTHAVATALELPEDYFDAWFTTPMVIMSPLHYPPQAASRGQQIDESRIGAGAHSDYGCLALLAQDDKGGLQVRNTAGRWIDAKPIPGTFVVNVGDMLARWTNDLFPATLHRVINTSGVDRYSIPFFYDPDHDAPSRSFRPASPRASSPGTSPRRRWRPPGAVWCDPALPRRGDGGDREAELTPRGGESDVAAASPPGSFAYQNDRSPPVSWLVRKLAKKKPK
jgi:isopenicillin N synthase-like dioxygenase